MAAAAKLSVRFSLPAVGELGVAAAAVLVPARVSGLVLTATFAVFSVRHARQRARGCECFGPASGEVSPLRAATMTGLTALAALAVAVAGAPSVAGVLSGDARRALEMGLAAAVVARLWRAVFVARTGRGDEAASALVRTSALYLERRLSRRTLLQRIAVAGSALAVAPLRYLLYPGTALAVITPGQCGGGRCTDGFTAFCCQIDGGANTCPAGTFAGGWWMCTDYAGRRLCAEQGVRYYVDCNALPGREHHEGCHCAGGSCDNRRAACNVFRYGQCNTHVRGVTAVVCRMVMCENPSRVPELNCSSSLAVDNAVCAHDAPCLDHALQLTGAGGV